MPTCEKMAREDKDVQCDNVSIAPSQGQGQLTPLNWRLSWMILWQRIWKSTIITGIGWDGGISRKHSRLAEHKQFPRLVIRKEKTHVNSRNNFWHLDVNKFL